MRALVFVSLLLLASQGQCNIFDSLGDFFKGLGEAALTALESAASTLVFNATSTLGTVVGEAGQMLAFQVGSALNKRDLTAVLQLLSETQQLEQGFQQLLVNGFGEVLTQVQDVLTEEQHVIEALLSGQLDPQVVLDKYPEVQGEIQQVANLLNQHMFSDFSQLVTGLFGAKKRDGELQALLQALQPQLEQFLQPFATLLQQELETTSNLVFTLAHNLLQTRK